MDGILHVLTGIISLVSKQTRKTGMWLLALPNCKGSALSSLCYPAAASLIYVNPSFHVVHA